MSMSFVNAYLYSTTPSKFSLLIGPTGVWLKGKTVHVQKPRANCTNTPEVNTFCISALEMLSRLSLRTSVMAEVMASACLVRTPS